MTTLYLIRHAQSHPTHRVAHPEWPLSTVGQSQAIKLAPVLASLNLEKMYSSPFLRCRETIRPFIEKSQMAVEIVDDLRERLLNFGLIDNFVDVWKQAWDDFDYKLPECECSRSAQARFLAALRKIASENRGKTIGVSTHGMVIGLFLNHLDEKFLRLETEAIRNPDIFKVTIQDEEILWHRDFQLTDLAGICTLQHETPIDKA